MQLDLNEADTFKSCLVLIDWIGTISIYTQNDGVMPEIVEKKITKEENKIIVGSANELKVFNYKF
jgi:hypothetical protein